MQLRVVSVCDLSHICPPQTSKIAAPSVRLAKAQRAGRLVVRAEEEAKRGQAADANKQGTADSKVQKVGCRSRPSAAMYNDLGVHHPPARALPLHRFAKLETASGNRQYMSFTHGRRSTGRRTPCSLPATSP